MFFNNLKLIINIIQVQLLSYTLSIFNLFLLYIFGNRSFLKPIVRIENQDAISHELMFVMTDTHNIINVINV
jgi:hypothetical protein